MQSGDRYPFVNIGDIQTISANSQNNFSKIDTRRILANSGQQQDDSMNDKKKAKDKKN